MNNFTGIGQIARASDLTYQGQNQTPMIKVSIDMMTRYTNTGDRFTVEGIAWGKVADQIAAIQDGAVLLIVGELNIFSVDRGEYTDKVPSVKITEIVTQLPELIAFNQVDIFGNVGQDVDVKYFDSGKNKAGLTLAVRRTKDVPDWFSIELWGDVAKVAEKYVAKGSSVGVTGCLKFDSWTDKETGEVRSKPVIAGRKIHLGGKNQDVEAVGGTSRYDRTATSQATSQAPVDVAWFGKVGERSKPSTAPAIESKWEHSSNESVEPHFDDIPF